MVKNDNKIARILIAYDGSGYSHAALNELQRSGLPDKAEVIIISVSEIWLPPVMNQESKGLPDSDVAEYFQKHCEQADRNLAEAKVIVSQARCARVGTRIRAPTRPPDRRAGRAQSDRGDVSREPVFTDDLEAVPTGASNAGGRSPGRPKRIAKGTPRTSARGTRRRPPRKPKRATLRPDHDA